MTEGERALVRNAAVLTLRCETLQGDAVAGRPVDSEELTRLANSSARVLAALRRDKAAPRPDRAPELHAYLDGHKEGGGWTGAASPSSLKDAFRNEALSRPPSSTTACPT